VSRPTLVAGAVILTLLTAGCSAVGSQASAQAAANVRGHAHQLQGAFDALHATSDARTRVTAAEELIDPEYNQPSQTQPVTTDWTHVFRVSSGATTSSISFAVDAAGQEPNTIDAGVLIVELRLCLQLTWTGRGPSTLRDTPCPIALQPEHATPYPWVDNVIPLDG
jgi:hypothetical protein